MGPFLSLASWLDKISREIGKAASWLILPLIFIIMFDVITRKVDFIKDWSANITIQTGYSLSFIFQDFEWHLHGALLLLTFGFGYLFNAHVRVDIFRETASRRGQAWIELLGLLICAIPFFIVMIKFSWDMTFASYKQGEGSESQVGIGMRFIIKSFLIWGFLVVLLACLATLIRCWTYLFGSEDGKKTAEKDLQFFTDMVALPKVVLEPETAEGKADAAAENGAKEDEGGK